MKKPHGPVMKWLGTDVRVMQVVVTSLTLLGDGTPTNPLTHIQEVWTMEGEKIAEYDPREDVEGEKP